MAGYSGNEYEMYMMANRLFGPYKYFYYALLFCNVAAPAILWFQKFAAMCPLCSPSPSL